MAASHGRELPSSARPHTARPRPPNAGKQQQQHSTEVSAQPVAYQAACYSQHVIDARVCTVADSQSARPATAAASTQQATQHATVHVGFGSKAKHLCKAKMASRSLSDTTGAFAP